MKTIISQKVLSPSQSPVSIVNEVDKEVDDVSMFFSNAIGIRNDKNSDEDMKENNCIDVSSARPSSNGYDALEEYSVYGLFKSDLSPLQSPVLIINEGDKGVDDGGMFFSNAMMIRNDEDMKESISSARQSSNEYDASGEDSFYGSFNSENDEKKSIQANITIESLKLISNSVSPVFLVKTFLPLVLDKLGMDVANTNTWAISAIAAPTFVGVSMLTHIKYHVENNAKNGSALLSSISKLKKATINSIVAFLLVKFNFWAAQALSSEYGQENANAFDIIVGLLIGFGFNIAEIYMAYRESAKDLGISECSSPLLLEPRTDADYQSIS